MTKEEFIEAIANAVIKFAPQYNISVHSPIIAQACLESAYGTSNKAQHNNFFGLKYRKNRVTCNSGYFNDSGSEQNTDGTYTPISTDWYGFATLEDGVQGYFQFINVSNYDNLKNVTDPLTYLENIKSDGYATSVDYVQKVYKVIQTWNLDKYDKGVDNMSNSSLVNVTNLSPNHSGARTHAVDRITPHCFVGQVTASRGLACFTSTSRQASCNYVIGFDGQVGLCVDEANRSWCSSSNANDQRAITIEVASDTTDPYAFKDAAYNKLVDLCVDICKRYGKTKLLWFSDKNTALNYNPASNEMVLTVHRWFAAKACPGDWMYSRMGQLASTVTSRLNTTQQTSQSTSKTLYRVQVGAYSSKTNANAMVAKLKKLGYTSIVKQVTVNGKTLYRVQTGAFSKRENANAMLKTLSAKGINGIITE